MRMRSLKLKQKKKKFIWKVIETAFLLMTSPAYGTEEESFGNIKYNSLEESVIRSGFKKYWNLTKDHIEVCKDCEFRYICTDCRAYTERTHFEKELDISKPLKCGYDPYTCQWEEWAKNPLKQKAAQYYNYKDRTDRRFLV